MEENNKKGPGVFYAVVGVATLLVAIIGATFAYFSASKSSDGDNIHGETNDVAAGLTLTVTRVTPANLGGTATTDALVPATITSDTAAGINTAVATNHCEKDGYTGCHVYEITATSTQTIASADILLTLSSDATNVGDWKYLVYQGTTAKNATDITTNKASFPATRVDIHKGGFTKVGDNPASVTYYLMIFIEESNAQQNDTSATAQSTTTTNATGTYEGTVTLQAAGNQVTADLSA